MRPKSLVRSMSRIITPTTIVNFSSGSVIDQNLCQGDAPSALATPWLSIVSVVLVEVWHNTPFLMLVLLAGILTGVLCQTSTSTTDTIDSHGVANQSK